MKDVKIPPKENELSISTYFFIFAMVALLLLFISLFLRVPEIVTVLLFLFTLAGLIFSYISRFLFEDIEPETIRTYRYSFPLIGFVILLIGAISQSNEIALFAALFGVLAFSIAAYFWLFKKTGTGKAND